MKGKAKFENQNSKFEELEGRVGKVIAAGKAEDFQEMALEVYRFQRGANGAYDQYCRALGVTEGVTDWREIPAVPQAAFKHAELRAFPAEAEVAAFRTSGTTGEGFGVHHFCSMRLYDEAILRGWDLLGVPTLPQIVLVPSPAAAPHSSLSHMMGTMKARALGGEQNWCVGDGGKLDLERLEWLCHVERPVLLLGTALAFLNWFEAGADVKLPAGSVVFETGGYKGSGRTLSKGELYGMIERRLGIEAEDVINEYGMTELSSQCYTRGLGKPHVAPPWVRAIAVDPATGREVADGEMGVLRIYDLANVGAVMGIQTRDLAIRRGADFELLGRDPGALPRGCSRAADEMMGGSRKRTTRTRRFENELARLRHFQSELIDLTTKNSEITKRDRKSDSTR